jgi:WD40 repeat protein
MTDCPQLEALEQGGADVVAHLSGCESCRAVTALIERRRAHLVDAPCARFEELIALRETEPLSGADERALEAHLLACEACQAIAGAVGSLDALLADHAELPVIDRSTYVVGSEIAQGGMGRVLEARDRRIGRQVALKEVLGQSPEMKARFEREARLTARLQHPGIVSIYEIGRWPGGSPFYVMPRLPGRTLREAIARAPGSAERIALLPTVVAAAEAIAYAHSRRIIHRDLTPANVLIGSFGETVVIDWGLAKDLGGGEPETAPPAGAAPVATTGQVSRVGVVLGTAAYMPPEQAFGLSCNERGDVYALGAILYQLLSGHAPFRGATTEEILEQVRRAPPPPPDGPRDLISIVEKAMARDPDRRYPTARELADELNRFVAGQLVRAREYGPWERLRRWVRRNRAVVTTSAVFLTALAMLAAWSGRRIVLERDRALAANAQLLEDQGRQELLLGHPSRALPYLSAAYSAGVDGADMRYLLHAALRNLEAGVLTTPGALHEQTKAVFSPDSARLAIQRGADVVVLDVPGGAVRLTLSDEQDARFTATGRLIARRAGAVRAHDGSTGALLRTFEQPGGIDDYELSRDGRRLLTSSRTSESARVWDLDSGALLLERQATQPTLHRLFSLLSPDGTRVVTSGFEEPTQIWSLDGKGRPIELAPGSAALAWDEAAKRLLVVENDGPLAIWDAAGGKRLVVLAQSAGPRGRVIDGAFDPSGARAVTASLDGTVTLWETATGRRVRVLGFGLAVVRAVFDGKGDRLALFGDDTAVRIYSARHGGLLATFEGHREAARAAVFSPDGRWLVSGEDPNENQKTGTRPISPPLVHVWNARASRERALIPSEPATVIQETSRRIITAPDDLHVRAWDLDTGELVHDYGQVGAVAVANLADRWAVSMPSQREGQIVDANSLATVCRFTAGSAIQRLAFSSDGETVVSWSDDRAPELWSGRTCARGGELPRTPGPITDITLDRAGARAILQDKASGPAELWDLRSRTRIAALGQRYTAITWSPDGRWFVLASWLEDEPRATAFEAETGRPLYRLPQPFFLSFSSGDSALLASPRFDSGGAIVRDALSGRERERIPGDSNGTFSSSFAAAPELIVTTDASETVKVWHRPTQRLLDAWPGEFLVRSLAMPRHGVQGHFSAYGRTPVFSEDRRHLIGGSGPITVFDFSLEERAPDEVARLAEKLSRFRLVDGALQAIEGSEPLPIEPVEPPGTLRGRVLHGGAPVEHARVVASRSDELRRVAETAADGTFLLELPRGGYEVRASSDGLRAFGVGPKLEIASGQAVAPLELSLDRPPSIAGRVVDGDGKPVREANVHYFNGKDDGVGVTDRDGKFVIFGLTKSGDYVPEISTGLGIFAPARGLYFEAVKIDGPDTRADGIELTVKPLQ